MRFLRCRFGQPGVVALALPARDYQVHTHDAGCIFLRAVDVDSSPLDMGRQRGIMLLVQAQDSRHALARVARAQRVRSVEWQCGSIWTPDATPAFRTAMASDTIQRDAAGVVWRRAMCSERAAIEIFNYDDTPPQSRHPTPAQDLEHMHVA